MLDSLSVIKRGTECSHSEVTVSSENVLKAYKINIDANFLNDVKKVTQTC